jgi:uncharacterized membrane-anchored protein YhcB (DUF1043 family)
MSEFAVIIVVLVVLGFLRLPRRQASDDGALTRTVRDLQRQLDATQSELDQQRLQVAELAERLDFAERRLVQIQGGKPLPPPA